MIDKKCPGLRGGLDGKFEDYVYHQYRPTVAVVAVVGWREVLLVQPSKRSGDDDHPCWILPQGGIDPGWSPMQALSRELQEELGLHYSMPMLHEMVEEERLVMLGSYVNDRRDDQIPKLILTVAMELRCPHRIKLNGENIKRGFAKDAFQLQGFLGHTRATKAKAVLEAVTLTHQAGLIGWSCDKVEHQPAQVFEAA